MFPKTISITIEKQLAVKQSTPKVIDYIALENIGIINSKSSFSVCGGKSEIDEFYSNLGQPFYIDSLFFGCEFPATKKHYRSRQRGQIIYYIGKVLRTSLSALLPLWAEQKAICLLICRNHF